MIFLISFIFGLFFLILGIIGIFLPIIPGIILIIIGLTLMGVRVFKKKIKEKIIKIKKPR